MFLQASLEISPNPLLSLIPDPWSSWTYTVLHLSSELSGGPSKSHVRQPWCQSLASTLARLLHVLFSPNHKHSSAQFLLLYDVISPTASDCAHFLVRRPADATVMWWSLWCSALYSLLALLTHPPWGGREEWAWARSDEGVLTNVEGKVRLSRDREKGGVWLKRWKKKRSIRGSDATQIKWLWTNQEEALSR